MGVNGLACDPRRQDTCLHPECYMGTAGTGDLGCTPVSPPGFTPPHLLGPHLGDLPPEAAVACILACFRSLLKVSPCHLSSIAPRPSLHSVLFSCSPFHPGAPDSVSSLYTVGTLRVRTFFCSRHCPQSLAQGHLVMFVEGISECKLQCHYKKNGCHVNKWPFLSPLGGQWESRGLVIPVEVVGRGSLRAPDDIISSC